MTGPHPVPTVGTAGISSRILDQNGAQAVTVEGPIPICRYGPIGTRGAHGLRLMVRPQLIEAAERITADPFLKFRQDFGRGLTDFGRAGAGFRQDFGGSGRTFGRMSAGSGSPGQILEGFGRAWAGFRQDSGRSGRTSAGLRQDVGWIWEPRAEFGRKIADSRGDFVACPDGCLGTNTALTWRRPAECAEAIPNFFQKNSDFTLVS